MTLPPRLRALAKRLLPQAVGYVDRFDADRVAGWAVDPKDPSRPARLTLHVDGRHEMNVLANLPRDDVAQTGRAPLNCGFDAALPARLRDGAAHKLELRLERDGTLLRGGRLKLSAGEAALVAAPWAASPLDGLCWFDRDRGAVTGWATGTGHVELAWDEGAPTRVTLDREVPGFGAFSQHGFSVRVPPGLADGRTHLAHVTVAGAPLQGSPVRVGLTSDRPVLTLIPEAGRRLRIEARDATGNPVAPGATVLADGTRLEAAEEPAALTVTLPPEVRHVVVTDGEGAVLARRVATPGRALEDWSADLPAPELDAARLSDDLCERARAAFDAFCADPDDRFDPTWYAATAGLEECTAPAEALAHWRDTGAARGLPPGPGIDEAAARALHPALARAIEDGRLPCGFAVELVLGRGAMGSLTGLARANRPLGRADPPPLPAEEAEPGALPLPSDWQAPPDGIHAAYLARLSDGDRARALADERGTHRDVATVPLASRPLVSIVMPSWNRAFTIAEAIQSVIEQSYDNWELLVCDDASEDRTADVVRGFDDPRIRYMRFLKSNGAGARNNGLRFARGEVIAYLDSDNLWHPLFLDRMLRALEAAPGVPIAYSSYLDTETIGARITLQEVARPAFRPVQLSGKNFMDLNSIVHHRRVFDWLGGFDEALPRLQDWDLALRYTSVFRASHVDRTLVFYRRNIAWGQVTHTQMGSNAQATVGEKTRARLAGDHARLAIDWPAPPKTTVLLMPPPGQRGLAPGDAALARGLADLARAHGPVEAVAVGEAEGFAALPASLLDDPARLSQALAGHVAEGATLAVGPARATLRALPDLDPARTLTLDQTQAGTMLVPLSDPRAALPLGAVPLEGAPGAPPSEPRFLVLGLRAEAQLDPLRREAARIGVALDTPRRAASDLAAHPSLVLVLRELADLDPYEFALLQALQSRGTPSAVPPEGDPAGFGNQWIESRAAFALTRTDAEWVFEKTAKLLSDTGTMARLSERSAQAHAIACHPALARERLAHALWWVLAR
ncbi:glycosyltransferase [Jannaschia formosa]|uniref:glycosyltransferase n=1 Tax=Jannaschia formosa TaxID=2259592 RepID=UPI000E1B736D|nr:glycosyltransferase [Jannaschia formosa]TFL17138.1 glycosyltransferase [Jannaschia formosa]